MTVVDVSVILTVLNEEGSICGLLDSLAEQTRVPNQVIICDGGSVDGTVAAVHDAVTKHGDRLGDVDVFVIPRANISRGRNEAIARARGPLIAATDAGVRLDRHWLERITSPWRCPEQHAAYAAPLAAGGFFVPDANTVFETAMSATVLPVVDEIDPDKFLPSSRSVAFLKSTWQAAGHYPEWLDYCEDLLFDFSVNALEPTNASAFEWRPEAVVHFRPRSGFRSFWKQYYRYARGDGKADLWRKRHAIRYVTYLVALPLLLSLTVRGGAGRAVGFAGLLAGGIAFCWRPLRRLRRIGSGLNSQELAVAALLIPVIRVVGDFAKMAGYPVGLCWRWRNRHRSEIHWRDGMDT